MASTQEIQAGKAYVRLFLKNDMSRQLVRALKMAQKKLQNFSRSAMMAGLKMTATGAAIAAPLVLGMREFANFDAQMRNVSTMLDNPDEFMPGFRQGIQDMAVEFGKTKDDLATGLYDILSATVPPELAMQRLAAATKLASAGNAEVGASVSVLNTLMDTYGDSFEDAADGSDFLFAIVKRGRTNLTELSGSLGNIIATAKAAGMSVEDMGAAVALLTRATGGTDTALTALQAISATFLKPGTEGAQLWKEKFGEAMDASTLKAIGMTGVLERLSTLDPGEVAKIFPNLRALRGIFPAISKMQGFSDDLVGMANRAGNVGTAFEKIKGPLFYWNQGLELGKNIMLEIGEAVASAILPYKDAILATGKAIAALVMNNKGLVVAVAAVAAGLMVAGVALTGLGVMAYGASIALGGLAAIVSAVLSPIGLITAAVVGAAVAFYRWTEAGKAAYESLSSTLGGLLEWFKEVFGGISDAMSAGDMQLAAEVMWAGIKVAWTKGISWVRTQWGELRFFLVDTWGQVAFGILDTMNFLWSEMVTGFWSAIDKIVDAWKWAEKSFAKGIGFVLAKLQGLDPDEVLSNLDQDYGRQQAGRDTGRSARDKANQEVADARFAANEAARQEWSKGAVGKRDADLAGAEDGLAKARKRLADAIDAARSRREETAVTGGAGVGAGVSAGGGGAGGGLGPSVSAAPRGVALTATYSAAAARIAGYQPGGPEKKMADGIGNIDKNTRELVTQIAMFVAGWRVP